MAKPSFIRKPYITGIEIRDALITGLFFQAETLSGIVSQVPSWLFLAVIYPYLSNPQ
jgi:hypothetical protein